MSGPTIFASFKKGDNGVEVRSFKITKTGKGKSRKRKQASLSRSPTLWIDAKECGVAEFTEEHAEILFDELRKACRAFVQRVKAEPPKEAAVPVKPAPSPHVMDAAPYQAATVQTGETGATQTIEPVFEVRPTRTIPDAGPPKPRTEADELAEGMRLAGLA